MTLEQAKIECRPFIEEILRRVQPRMIVLEGISLMAGFLTAHAEGVSRPIMEPEMALYRGRQARICIGEEVRIRGLDRPVAVVAIGHPSSFGRLPEFDKAIGAARNICRQVIGEGQTPGAEAAAPTSSAAAGHEVMPSKVALASGRALAPGGPTMPQPSDRVLKNAVGLAQCNLAYGCEVRIHPEGQLNRLEVWRKGVLLGEYERSIDAEVDRKINEIASALPMLLGVYEEHGRFQVRWNGKRRVKVVRAGAAGLEVATIGKEHWGKPTWRR